MEQGKMSAQEMLNKIAEMVSDSQLMTQGLIAELQSKALAPEMPFVWNRKVQTPDGDTIYTVRAWTFAELEARKAEILAALPAPLALPADNSSPTARSRRPFDREEELMGEDNHQDNSADLSQPTAEGTCPKCDGAIWDNRGDTNRPANTPLIKCRDREGCGWAVWAKKPRTGGDAARANAKKARLVTGRF